ncbi:hypothetical protein PVK06_028212 [Gossypium arboreum]|uniref:Uncharacterized protein n=1 Tax=Gossypium arboreum TaxID=29729 RepID=A0ABR0P2C6_GOSAR|nr:hypothetical protein PVK06_028212 [Gossypium arboreum]
MRTNAQGLDLEIFQAPKTQHPCGPEYKRTQIMAKETRSSMARMRRLKLEQYLRDFCWHGKEVLGEWRMNLALQRFVEFIPSATGTDNLGAHTFVGRTIPVLIIWPRCGVR